MERIGETTIDAYLEHFAGYERHIGFYPGASGIAAFQTEISGYKNAKGSVQFPLDKPLPRRIVRYRIEDNMAREAERTARKGRRK